MKKTRSFSTEILFIMMVGIVIVSALMWTGFSIGMRINADREIKRFSNETTGLLRDKINGRFTEYSLLLDFTATGALPIMLADQVDTARLRGFYKTMEEKLGDVQSVFGASAGRWDGPGEFMVFSNGWAPDDPAYDNTTRAWHKDAIAGGGRTIFTDPYIDMITKEPVISLVKGINYQGKTIGMAGIDVSIDALFDYVNEIAAMNEEKSTYIIHPSGRYIAHHDKSFIMEKDFFEHNGLQDFRSQILSPNGFYSGNGDLILCSMNIPVTGWTVVSVLLKSTIYKPATRTSTISIILNVIVLPIFGVILWLIVKKKMRPIVLMSRELEEISEGEGDLTKTVNINSTNEIGVLAHYFNLTIEKIKNLIINIKGETSTLSGIGNDLASNMTETAAAINQITANIQSIKGRVTNQSKSVNETHETMDHIVSSIDKLNGHIENQSNNISQASSAIEEMVANIQSVTNTLINNAANVKNLKEASEVGRGGLQEVATDIQEIARESEGLMEINSVMQNIASQTNLLSMNAAIEAAHAGESGKGFAVVADEIRKLAENSSAQSKTIGAVLKKIKGSIDKISRSTENVLNKFEAIDSSVKTVSDQEDNIRHAMEEQGIGSRQILDGVGNVNEITRQVKNDSNEMLTEAKEVIQESKSLADTTVEINSGMNEMATGADHINIAVHHVNEISTKNREAIETLIKEISRFKVE